MSHLLSKGWLRYVLKFGSMFIFMFARLFSCVRSFLHVYSYLFVSIHVHVYVFGGLVSNPIGSCFFSCLSMSIWATSVSTFVAGLSSKYTRFTIPRSQKIDAIPNRRDPSKCEEKISANRNSPLSSMLMCPALGVMKSGCALQSGHIPPRESRNTLKNTTRPPLATPKGAGAWRLPPWVFCCIFPCVS